jgi:uncharacterized membrane protein
MKRLFVALAAVALLSFMVTSAASIPGVIPYFTLDKLDYNPGDSGSISIIIRNLSDNPIQLKNVTVVFERWMKYTIDGWDEAGNWTIDLSDMTPISANSSIALDDIRFTVPSDARAVSTDADITIQTNQGPIYQELDINVRSPSELVLVRSLENIVTLLTLGALLAIIGAVIIAAAIFLTGRRPAPIA